MEKPIVVIPAYEPPASFVDYAKEVVKSAKWVVVVDDGSGEEWQPIFNEIAQMDHLTCLAHEENRGKGYALRTAFQYIAAHFSPDDIIITADCDGQHAVSDIHRVFYATQSHKNALMLGSRDFDDPIVPKRSRMGNKNIRAIFSLLYGIRLYDTQTGLRGLTVSLAERFLAVKGDRFEYEMGMLIYAKKHEIPIYETPISTIYPERAEDHVSHFKTVRDSAKMIGTVLKNLEAYLLSSALSALLDVLVFFLLTTFVFPEVSAVNTLIATISARVASSVLNFVLNFKCVFGGSCKGAVLRYYTLWLGQLGASYGLTFVFGNLLGLWLTGVKVAVDLLLAVCSYQIQQHWVFRGKEKNKFHGPLFLFVRRVARTFSKKYRANVLPYEEGVVYVTRHLNMHGPYTTLKWLEMQAHPMVFHPFLSQKACYRHFTDYTFSVRQGKKKKRFSMKAFFLSLTVPPLTHSLKSVPVYRGSAKSLTTLRCSLSYLLKGESLIVYPDVGYTDGMGTESEIYKGFLFLGEMYYKRTGKALKFVPIYIDDARHTLTEMPFVTLSDFDAEGDAAAEAIKKAINGKKNEEKEEILA